ncbi:hypothetical protein PI125_g25216 [Phytophthora idaei]|nr:hypothetical protein PI125_g25216 [Phytophthora idaei]
MHFNCVRNGDTSVDRALVPPSSIFGASAAASLTLAASLVPFESNALITVFTIDDYADTYGLIRGVIQRCRQWWRWSNTQRLRGMP